MLRIVETLSRPSRAVHFLYQIPAEQIQIESGSGKKKIAALIKEIYIYI